MLILSRKIGESIVIAGRIIVKVVRLDGDTVKLGVDAPREVPVHRQEIYELTRTDDKEAVTAAAGPVSLAGGPAGKTPAVPAMPVSTE